jgi:hypothetical protein
MLGCLTIELEKTEAEADAKVSKGSDIFSGKTSTPPRGGVDQIG